MAARLPLLVVLALFVAGATAANLREGHRDLAVDFLRTRTPITAADCSRLTAANRNVYWTKEPLTPGSSLASMSKYMYMCDEWKWSDVREFHRVCQALLPPLLAPGEVLADLQQPPRLLQAGQIVFYPIPVRSCNPGFTLVGSSMDATAHCYGQPPGGSPYGPRKVAANCYGGG